MTRGITTSWSFFSEVIGDYTGDLVAEYGTKAIAKGLKKIGLDEWSEKLLRNAGYADDVARKVADGLCSFSEDTTVMTRDGPVAIQDVRIGQEVLAFDEDTGQVGYYPVMHLWVHRDPLLVTLTIDDETVETTPEHPFYTTEGEWVAAAELQAGDRMRRADDSYGTVQAVAIVYRTQVMYNLTVEGAHTFFVGHGQWLVHNSCPIFSCRRSPVGTFSFTPKCVIVGGDIDSW